MDSVLDFSDEFVLSGGTVPIDIDKNLVLFLFNRPKKEYTLPKGRKNVGESLEAAAIRETFEETGFRCTLVDHDLPTRAPMSDSSIHTEPVAVQQRMHNGIRKLIFWYAARVDSTAQQLPDTQEEGEDFEATWASTEEAASRMSFTDDRMILEKALLATEAIRATSTPFSLRVREEYLDLSINARALGFLCLNIGGSIVFGASNIADLAHIKADTDWDGFGVVETQADIIRLINNSRSELCKLLRMEREEFPGMTLPQDPALRSRWDIVRFSGWTFLGSKRVIKIWSKESILRAASYASPSQLGVISHKTSGTLPCKHHIHGTHLEIFQPTRIATGLHILYDQDFFIGSAPVLKLADMTSMGKSVYCGVTSDLFLSSRTLFEAVSGILSSLENALLQKWLLLSDTTNAQNLYPFMYRSDRYTPYFSGIFQSKMSRLIRNMDLLSIEDRKSSPKSVDYFVKAQQSSYPAGPRGCVVIPRRLIYSATSIQSFPAATSTKPYPGVVASREYVQRPTSVFSSNSTGLDVTIQTNLSRAWQQAFVKQAETFHAELAALPLIGQYVSNHNLQTVIAVDHARRRIFYKRYEGKTFNSLRLQHHLRFNYLCQTPKDDPSSIDKLLLVIELRRAQDVSTAYSKSFAPSNVPASCAQQSIHRFFHERLQSCSRFRAFYGDHKTKFLQELSPQPIDFAKLLDLSWIINGKRFGSLRHYLRLATDVLDPVMADGISSLPFAFGLGDGHGGNLMVSPDCSPSEVLYIDYEVTGIHTPFLDLAKPLYMDGFFEVAYADLLYGDLSNHNDDNEICLQWKVEGDSVVVDYALNLRPLSQALAVVKLERTLVPAFEMLNRSNPSKSDLAENTLACALFSCALLTRDYSKVPNVFIINMALGIRLISSMRQVFNEVFGWRNWPQQPSERQGSRLHHRKTQSQELVIWRENPLRRECFIY